MSTVPVVLSGAGPALVVEGGLVLNVTVGAAVAILADRPSATTEAKAIFRPAKRLPIVFS
jgi:hypothetical protein